MTLSLVGGCFKGEVTGAKLEVVRIEAPSAKDCGACHEQQYREWSESAHAASFTNERFVAATNRHAFADCLGCHIPGSVFIESAPVARGYHRDEGVNCIVCHMKEGKLAGPVSRTGIIAPHETGEKDAFYRDSRLCGKCHEGTYREWLASSIPEKKNCQECHMSEVVRKMTEPRGFLSKIVVSFEKEIKQRRHRFSVKEIANLKEPPAEIAVENMRRTPDGLTADVAIVNRLPHRIPTGDYGYRKAILRVELSRDGAVRSSEDVELYKELGTAFLPGEPARYSFSLKGEGDELIVTLLREGWEGHDRTVILRKEVPIR